jgi:hypothetical protein
MKKRTVVILGIVLIAIAAISVASFVWQIEKGTVNYWLNDTLKYQLVNGEWQTIDYSTNQNSTGIHQTIYCRNDGFTTASFDLIIAFQNAVYSGSSDTPRTTIMWNKINDGEAKYSFIVSPYTTQSINVSFQIINGTRGFVVSLSFQDNRSLHVESAQYGSQPWETFYRTLYYGQASNNTYVAAHIS